MKCRGTPSCITGTCQQCQDDRDDALREAALFALPRATLAYVACGQCGQPVEATATIDGAVVRIETSECVECKQTRGTGR